MAGPGSDTDPASAAARVDDANNGVNEPETRREIHCSALSVGAGLVIKGRSTVESISRSDALASITRVDVLLGDACDSVNWPSSWSSPCARSIEVVLFSAENGCKCTRPEGDKHLAGVSGGVGFGVDCEMITVGKKA